MTPSTPRSPAYLSAPSTPSSPPGSWEHPNMDEICRRQAKAMFGDYSVMRITYNAVALIASFVLVSFLSTNETALSLASTVHPTLLTYAGYVLWVLRFVFMWNVVLELWKALRPLDDFSDIPLTQEQRKLLGLPETPGSANENFVTPPRYIKSTPASRTASPMLSTSSPTMQRRTSDFGSSEMSMGAPSSLSTPLRAGLRPLWDTPRSPKTGGTSSITPSNRWAFEKSIFARKGDPTATRLSPSKNIFSPR